MLLEIKSLEELEIEAKEIDNFLNIESSEQIEEVIERGNTISAYLARTSKMLADAKFWQDKAMAENTILANETYKHMPPSTKNKLIEAMCQKENYLFTWIGRLNATCTHQLDWLRTLVSKAKAEIYNSR